jgi:hypothetical protein
MFLCVDETGNIPGFLLIPIQFSNGTAKFPFLSSFYPDNPVL